MTSETGDKEHSRKMKRRDFIHTAALGGIVALGGVVAPGHKLAGLAGKGEHTTAPEQQPEPSSASAPFELEEATILDLQTRMAAGRHTARSIAEMYLARIAAIDQAGPGVNSVIEINPDALAIADSLDQERAEGKVRGPMHGIPVLLKDNIGTGDKMQTTAGSLALMGHQPGRDAFIVERLRLAGAVILGKTNLSEWANFRSMRSSSGWSARGGQTRNPYALDRNPCGSSSGSGAAVAANLCAVAIGTETDGSIVCPSSANSVVGIKPTLGVVSRSGIVPIAHSQDTAGPMARTVADAAILLGAIAGSDPDDPVDWQSPRGKIQTDYAQFLDAAGLAGARIGVARNIMASHEKVVALMDSALGAMRAAGATVIDPADLPNSDALDKPEFEVLLYEFKADLNAYLAARGGGSPGSLEELIRFNEQSRDREMPYFGQEIFIMAQQKGPLSSGDYIEALETCRRLSRQEGIDALLEQYGLDAIVAATGGPPWMTDLVNGDHYSGGCSTAPAVAGYPHITVPLGYVRGLPVGISFFGGDHSEPVLIRIAYAFERITRARRPPRLLATADLD